MDCKHIKSVLSEYLDEALTAEEAALVKAHLDDCPECRDEYEQLRQTVQVLSSLEEVIPPAGFRRELRRQLEEAVLDKLSKRFSLKSLIPVRWKRINRVQLLPVAVALALMLVLIPFVGNYMPGVGRQADKMPTADSLGKAESKAANQLSAEEELARKTAPAGKGGEVQFQLRSAAEMPEAESGAGNGQAPVDAPPVSAPEYARKIIKNADVSLQVDDYQAAVEAIKRQVETSGGYITSENVSAAGAGGVVSGHLQVRVPADRFDSFLSGMEGVGKLKSRNIYTQDVTEEYIDVESRLKAMRTKEERLLAILTKSGQLSDVLAVENELASTRAQIESMQGRLRYLNNRTEFSTISINIQQVAASTQQISGEGFKDVFKKTKEAFIKAVNNIILGTGALLVFIGSAVPYLVLITVVIGIAWWLHSRKRTGNGS
ncbi:MAG: DUF4349 domain-containing protein [Peptococcaceae bacterium]|jgi:hypothetical protein|nr:DUF4349 domain-containing protein [Peptococcaceae bacterium]MDH7526340.1 DUF4349 domain-containing protein [Peptococcaceae bacterium]